jgi:hypothetical protein
LHATESDLGYVMISMIEIMTETMTETMPETMMIATAEQGSIKECPIFQHCKSKSTPFAMPIPRQS